MSNQLNYPEPLKHSISERPSRLFYDDEKLLNTRIKQVIFGTTPQDNIEVWVYNVDGTFAGHTIIRPEDPNVTITTVVDVAGSQETLDIQMSAVLRKMGIFPGKYEIVLNMFRDEVGSEEGYKLFINKISQTRTEVIVRPIELTSVSKKDIYEFVEPSIPKIYVQGLIDETFNKSLEAPTQILKNVIMEGIEIALPGTIEKITKANQLVELETIINDSINTLYIVLLQKLAENSFDYQTQAIEFQIMIDTSVDIIMTNLISRGIINNYFDLI